MNAWVALLLAGMFEIGFTSFLKLSRDFSNLTFSALFLVSATASFSFLSVAMKTIPLGIAYATWTGIGVVGTAITGIIFFKDPVSVGQLIFLTLLVGSIAGLKVISG